MSVVPIKFLLNRSLRLFKVLGTLLGLRYSCLRYRAFLANFSLFKVIMKELIKQLYTPNSTVAHLVEHKTEDLRRTCWPRLEFKGLCKKLS